MTQILFFLQRSLGQMNRRHKKLRERFDLHYHSRPVWVVYQFCAQIQSDLRGFKWISSASISGPVDEMHSLCKKGHLDQALDSLFRMDQQGTAPTLKMCRTLLKACIKRKAWAQARRVYAHLAKHRSEDTTALGETLLNILVKCGSREDVLHVFHVLQQRTVLSWTAVISLYTKAGKCKEALRMYRDMRDEGVQPNKQTFLSLLKACGSIADLDEGRRIHNEAVHACGRDPMVGTSVVDMYAKCGSIVEAETVFAGLCQRDIVSWTAMLTAYVEQGDVEKAFQVYAQLHEDGMWPNSWTYVSALQACSRLTAKEDTVSIDGQLLRVESLQKGKAIHAKAWEAGYKTDMFVGNALVSMYGKCGSVLDSKSVLTHLPQCDVVSWTAMLTAHVQQGQEEDALRLYYEMQKAAVSPDDQTIVTLLQACTALADKEKILLVHGQSLRVRSLHMGKAIHADARRRGYPSGVFVGSALVSMYGRCGCFVDAKAVFDDLSGRNMVSWNGLIATYVQQGHSDKALQIYAQLQEEVGVSPNDRTFVSVLQACGSLVDEDEMGLMDWQSVRLGSLQKGKAVHAEARKRGYASALFVGSSLISMYGKCGSLMDAQITFDGLSERNVVSWNAILAAHAQQGQGERTLELYRQMRDGVVTPDDTTFVCILQACSKIGATDACVEIHHYLLSRGTNLSLLVGSALIHTYAACVRMLDAHSVLDALHQPDVVSWTTLIAGYARQGNVEASLNCYEKMLLAGVQPNGVTFLALLSACSHAGVVEKGLEYFESMSRDHCITPEIQHYSCMVDLLSRAGHFTVVEVLLRNMPMQPDLSLWLCLLGACRKHGNAVLGKRAFDCAVMLQPKHGAAYPLMSSIYAHAGMWECAEAVFQLSQKAGAGERPGNSWIEHEHQVQTFVVAESKDQLQGDIHGMLVKLGKQLRVKACPKYGSSASE